MDMKQKGHNPNDGESASHYDASGARSANVGDSAGVQDGLSDVYACSVKDAENVAVDQRVVSNQEDITSSTKGKFKMGY